MATYGLWWAGTGDDPPPGYPERPTVGLLEPILDPDPPSPGWPYSGIRVLGDGTVSGLLRVSAVGVRADVEYIVTLALTNNDVTVETAALTIPIDHPTAGWSGAVEVPFSNLAVADGDELRATISYSPAPFYFFRAPAGTGGVSLKLEISSGSLA